MVALHATPNLVSLSKILTEGVERTRSNRLKFRQRHVYPVGIIFMILTPIWLKCYSSFLSKEFYYLAYFVDSLLGYLKPFQGLDWWTESLFTLVQSSELNDGQPTQSRDLQPGTLFQKFFIFFYFSTDNFVFLDFQKAAFIEIIPKISILSLRFDGLEITCV